MPPFCSANYLQMKTLPLIIATLFITASIYAQSGNTGSTSAANKEINVFTKPDAVWMKQGKVMLVKGDIVYILENDITLSNGTIILNNGTVGEPDGTVIIMKEGEQLNFTTEIKYKTKISNSESARLFE